jgi:hypothetical protein
VELNGTPSASKVSEIIANPAPFTVMSFSKKHTGEVVEMPP